ncbi:putative Orotate phosphoribosyltransferase [Nitrospira sp. KM1]|uniref:hypothetical protein n=1 Tax=Nitrospira sp. KM1 TaxID=1936990 RepID=UPI0013A76D2A|nr:hypothetical protein [Nitrospira sp. KM1]BCA53338.1 putative Orotate phosphoribosyltransferase [Nitrospira sp. KM1]
MTTTTILSDLVTRHRDLYGTPSIDQRLETIIRAGSHTSLTECDILHILRTSRSVFFDTHVEVVSGHHTATYLRFESISRYPEFVSLVTRDMADWIGRTFQHEPLTGLIATSSAASLLATGTAKQCHRMTTCRVALTPYNGETGKIGTDIAIGTIQSGERFIALNDVTTRGNCVSKLGKIVTDNGGVLAGMMVFARRDSGQFPLMNELTARHPFYYSTDLDMPQWEASHCPLCRMRKPLLSWRDVPEV